MARRRLLFAFEGAAELNLSETEAVAKFVGGCSELFEFLAARRVQEIELFSAVGEITESRAEQSNFSCFVAMRVKEREKGALNVCVEMHRLGHGARTSIGVEPGVTNGESNRAGGKARFAQALASFLRKMAEHGIQRGQVVGIFAKGVIVRNGFGLRVDDEFVGIAAAGFAIERRPPLTENLFQLVRGMFGKLCYGFNAEGAKGALGDFADAGNFADGKRREEFSFLAGCNPYEAARFGLIACHFCGEARRREAAGAGKPGLARDGTKQFVRGGERRAVHAFSAGKIEIGFVY